MTNFLESYPYLKGTIILVTYGRSGSTLLSRMLRTIPGTCLRGENYNTLSHLYRAYVSALETRSLQGKIPRDEKSAWYGAERVEPNDFADALVDCFIEQIIRPQPSVRWIGFKEIRFYELGNELGKFLDFIGTFFPNARFVFNTRPWEDVARSAWFAKKPAEEVRNHVTEMDARFADYCSRHPETTFAVEYRQYSKNTRSLKALFEFLDEDFDLGKCQEVADLHLTH